MTTTDYLITGGAGFIGSHLADRLIGAGNRVRILDNLSTGSVDNLTGAAKAAELIIGDLRNEADVRKAVDGADAVIHLAALGSVPRSVEDPMTTHDVNATGTLRVLLAARDAGCRRVVLAGSSSTYGDHPGLPKVEELTGNTLSPYATTKAAAEDYCRQFTSLYDLDTVVLRFFNVFGPRQRAGHAYAAAIPLFIDWARRNQPILVHGDGEQSRDFTFIDNNVDGIVLAATAERSVASGKTYNLACGGRTTINEILEQLAELSPDPLDIRNVDPRPADVRHSQADISKIAGDLGYAPTIDVVEGIRRTWDWFESSEPPPAG